MSDQKIIDKIEITQRNRWHHRQTDRYSIIPDQISLNNANVIIIPKNEKIEDKLDEIYKGSLIEMKEYLIKITKENGWYWKSSLRRNDTTGGWVEDLTILDSE